MSIRFLTGGGNALRDRLGEEMRKALSMAAGRRDTGEDEGDILLVVPGQLTLEMERFALEAASVSGSFRLKVLSPARLYESIFAQAGGGKGGRIDERGRAMLVRRALHDINRPLEAFERARKGAGFAPLAAKQIADCKEAGLSPADLLALAEKNRDEPIAAKLRDIAVIYEAYEARLAQAGLDEDAARREALNRVADAPSMKGARVWFYGFDLLTLPIARCVTAMAGACRETTVLLELRKNGNARDWRLFEPVQRSYERSLALAREAGIPCFREALDERPAAREPRSEADELKTLSEELYAYPPNPYRHDVNKIALRSCRNPRDEAEHVAASIRRLVRERGWRYRDIAVACQDTASLYASLRRAFSLYEIPAFFAESRPAHAHPLGASLLCALRLAARKPAEDDIQSLLSLGYSGVSSDEADFLRNFARERGIQGSRWLRAYRPRGEDDAEGARFEEARSRLADPIAELKAGLRAKETKRRLRAVYEYLRACGCYEIMLENADALAAAGRAVEASEGEQVWARILVCLDQMEELFGEGEPLPAPMLSEMFEAALRATDVKPLPQSADAVSAGDLSHMKTQPVKTLFIVGATDADEPSQTALLMEEEASLLAKEVWLGPNKNERACLRMLAAKRCLALAEEFVSITWSESDMNGSARRPGSLVRGVRAVFPGLGALGGVSYDPEEAVSRMSHPDAAILRAGEAISAGNKPRKEEIAALRALSRFPERRSLLDGCRQALQGDALAKSISAPLAKRLYGGPRRVSVTRLERYAACPLRHFVDYGARPKENREFGIDPRDAGLVCHDALERFAKGGAEEDLQKAVERMDEITSELMPVYLPGFMQTGALELADAEALRSVARRAAVTYCKQMAGSLFTPVSQETDFRGEDAISLSSAKLEGRIDRVDLFESEGKTYIRVIDYKRGSKKMQIAKVYYGLQLQLLVYLLAAARMYGAEPAAVLYFNVSDPLAKTDSVDPQEVEAEREGELRMDGALLNDEKIVLAMADPPEAALPVRLKVDGTLTSSDKLLTSQDFQLLAEKAVLEAERALAGICSGDVEARPAFLGQETPCERCPYASVCRLDPLSKRARERRLQTLRASEALEKLRNEANGGAQK